MSNILTVNYIVQNSGKYVRYFLGSLKNQTFRDFNVQILDNNSTDDTREIIKREYPEFKLHENNENIGVWAAFEKLLRSSTPKYVVCMTDVILKENFIEKVIETMESNPDCGALQAKVYQINLYAQGIDFFKSQHLKFKLIDTCGFQIFKSRKVINLGHGEKDKGQYDKPYFAKATKGTTSGEVVEIFAVEGAVPIFRREALESCRIDGHIIDPDYRIGSLGYGDDLDLAWRMRLFGWKHLFAPNVIAYHDRSTTKGYSKSLKNYLHRVKERQKIDILKRRLDWRNVRFTIIKNDYIINILKDLPYILLREIGVLAYTILFEPKVILELPNFIKYLSKMLEKRKKIMRLAKANPKEIRKWFK